MGGLAISIAASLALDLLDDHLRAAGLDALTPEQREAAAQAYRSELTNRVGAAEARWDAAGAVAAAAKVEAVASATPAPSSSPEATDGPNLKAKS